MTALDPIARSTPAEIYDRLFVPALFARWGPVLADAARLSAGDRVLDVACGTGAATLAAAARVGPTGSVTGLDPNPDMLAVARGKGAPVDWRDGVAEALPFPDASFDAVVSQFGMMFFTDRRGRGRARCCACCAPAGGSRSRSATRSSARPATASWRRCSSGCSAARSPTRSARRSRSATPNGCARSWPRRRARRRRRAARGHRPLRLDRAR